MEQPLVSWLMPVYNAEKTLVRAMDSMLNQTYKNIEIIVINDNSYDNTSVLLSEYQNKDSRVKVFINKNRAGVAGALNYGLPLCKGKYIARMDADDVSSFDRLEKQVRFMENDLSIDILGTAVRRIDMQEGTKITYYCPTDPEEIRCWLLFNIQAVHPSIMFRAETVKRLNIQYPYVEAEDYDLFASLVDMVKMANIDEPLLDYYVNTANQVTSVIKKSIRRVNNEVSRKAIERTLHIDTSPYEDIIFGARHADNIPYDIKGVLEHTKELFYRMHQANLVYGHFNQQFLDQQLEDEYNSIKGKLHCAQFKMSRREAILCNLNNIEYNFTNEYPHGKVIIYGTGSWAKRNVADILKAMPIDVLAYCDSNVEKHGEYFLGKPIISPEDISKYEFDYIITATPLYANEIKDYLVKNKIVSRGRIFDFGLLIDLKFFADRAQWIREYSDAGSQKRVFLFGAADYSNMGDHAIAYAEVKKINELLGCDVIEVPLRRYSLVADIAKQFIKPRDLILISGGGYLGSLWMHSEVMVREIIETYPENQIIIMPQTLYWGIEEYLKKEIALTKEIYSKHKKLTICARDYVSEHLMKEYYPQCRIIMAPDMVLAIDWRNMTEEKERESVLLCLKKDKESILTESDKQKLRDVSSEVIGSFIEIDNMHEKGYVYKEEREEALKKHLEKFASARICITDRLHGMIFSAITGTPCIALDSCNHKLRATYKWLESLPYVHFANNIEEIDIKLIDKVEHAQRHKFDSKQMDLYFKILYGVIQNSFNEQQLD